MEPETDSVDSLACSVPPAAALGPTPGPWTDKSPDESQWGIYDAHGISLGQAFQIHPMAVDQKQRERTANARLMAAAPDLLAALQLAVRQNSHDMQLTGEELRLCEAAIAKATTP